jgi:hypothetical protein
MLTMCQLHKGFGHVHLHLTCCRACELKAYMQFHVSRSRGSLQTCAHGPLPCLTFKAVSECRIFYAVLYVTLYNGQSMIYCIVQYNLCSTYCTGIILYIFCFLPTWLSAVLCGVGVAEKRVSELVEEIRMR